METKKEIRRKILEIRGKMTLEECEDKSIEIISKVLQSEQFHKARNLLVYVDYQNEVQTHRLIEVSLQRGKRVFCPKIIENEMKFFQIMALSELTEGYKGILEPAEIKEKQWEKYMQTDASKQKTLVIMPGVAFDRYKHRIGYGKGFYDRFLKSFGNVVSTIALCFTCQLAEQIPYEEFDVIPEYLYTENEIL